MAVFEVDIRSFRRYADWLQRHAPKAIPHAAREGLNYTAFDARHRWQDEIRRAFTLRNQFTERSVRVDKARGTNIRAMQAVTGSVAPWMARQEMGGIAEASRDYLPIPQDIARRGGSPAKLVKASARLAKIKVQRGDRPSGGSVRKRNFIALLRAKRQGRKHALLERDRGGYTLARVMGGKRKIKARMLYDLSRGSVRTPAEPTLTRTLSKIGPQVRARMMEALERQIKLRMRQVAHWRG